MKLRFPSIKATSQGLFVRRRYFSFFFKEWAERDSKYVSWNQVRQPAIPKFDGHYDHWFMLMKNFLRSKEYWSLVETGIPVTAEGVEITEAQQKTIADQKLKDLKVKNYLF